MIVFGAVIVVFILLRAGQTSLYFLNVFDWVRDNQILIREHIDRIEFADTRYGDTRNVAKALLECAVVKLMRDEGSIAALVCDFLKASY